MLDNDRETTCIVQFMQLLGSLKETKMFDNRGILETMCTHKYIKNSCVDVSELSKIHIVSLIMNSFCQRQYNHHYTSAGCSDRWRQIICVTVKYIFFYVKTYLI